MANKAGWQKRWCWWKNCWLIFFRFCCPFFLFACLFNTFYTTPFHKHHHHSAQTLNVRMWFYLPLNCSCVDDLFTFLVRSIASNLFHFWSPSNSVEILELAPCTLYASTTMILANIIRHPLTEFSIQILFEKAHKCYTFCHSNVVWIHTAKRCQQQQWQRRQPRLSCWQQ